LPTLEEGGSVGKKGEAEEVTHPELFTCIQQVYTEMIDYGKRNLGSQTLSE